MRGADAYNEALFTTCRRRPNTPHFPRLNIPQFDL